LNYKLPLAALAALIPAFATPAQAQAIQFDLGTFNGAPSSTYGGAAAQAGFWNHMTSAAPLPLLNTSGAATAASVSAPVTFTNFAFGSNNPNTTGDDELLLDGVHDGPITLEFTGLTNGTYDVYTYAWAPDFRTLYLTSVDVPGSTGPQIVGGADWGGAHIQGITYAKHNVAVTTGTLTIICTVSAQFATVNAVQLDPVGAPPISYCVAKTTANGCSPTIGFSGNASATAGSGFIVNGTSFINNKSCLLFYGSTGQAATPFQGGTLCVKTPIKRTPGTNTFGNPPPNDCSGAPGIDMNLFAVGGGGGIPLPALTVPGTVIDCQWWGRDPGFAAPNNTQLSNGLEYTVGP
jgi:hypothetical protein